jgi:hypothetical protein
MLGENTKPRVLLSVMSNIDPPSLRIEKSEFQNTARRKKSVYCHRGKTQFKEDRYMVRFSIEVVTIISPSFRRIKNRYIRKQAKQFRRNIENVVYITTDFSTLPVQIKMNSFLFPIAHATRDHHIMSHGYKHTAHHNWNVSYLINLLAINLDIINF